MPEPRSSLPNAPLHIKTTSGRQKHFRVAVCSLVIGIFIILLAVYLEPPPKGGIRLGSMGGLSSYAGSINEKGQIIGVIQTKPEGYSRAFFWDKESGMQDLGSLGGSISMPFGINRDG
jgi:probable HAF family extracellular repeat protein